MGFSLKKALKSAGKLVRPIARGAARAALASATGGASEVALRVAKGIGAHRPKPLPDVQPVSVVAAIEKATMHAPGKLKVPKSIRAVARPGGSKIAGAVGRIARRARKAASGKGRMARSGVTAVARRLGRKKRGAGGGGARNFGGKRAAPFSTRTPGAKDLKALSASWKAAGKPTPWLEWVKTH